ncbi:HlyD family secretion protein [Blastochloris viridis]|uniref:Inner membrane protein yibH n=1 Tax=Blastochloris viridis TaxID=1079 RepID=A0A0H5B9G2_BLAVI|nr:HlyD family secretion protein [Blastochloris viridis]ALK07901.1 putative multidrug resistance protein EmrK [Blastochloris viridis]BAR98850.1 MFS multidrug efflux pump [Blastochloris viridis]CUU43823.1 Inner membrane protein yibH [Blastochloris viridis]
MKTTDLIDAERPDSPAETPAAKSPGAKTPPILNPPTTNPPAAPPPAAPVQAEAPRPSRVRRVLPVIALLLAGAVVWYGYHWWTEGRFLVSTDDAYIGAESATLAPKIAALVAQVPVEANQRIAAGDPVVVLDDGDYRLALVSAEAKRATQAATVARIDQQIAAARIGIDQAKAQLDAAVADRVRAEADFSRAEQLFTRDVGAKATVDKATADRDRARALEAAARGALEAAKLNVGVLQAQRAEAARVAAELDVARDRAKRDLDFTVIRAPFAGVIANKSVQAGDYVSPGKRLAALVPVENVYIDANFKETQIARIRPGAIAHIQVDADPGRDILGTVDSIAPGSGAVFSLLPPENATGNFTKIVQRVPVRIKVPAEIAREGRLRPGLSVVVEIDTRTPN